MSWTGGGTLLETARRVDVSRKEDRLLTLRPRDLGLTLAQEWRAPCQRSQSLQVPYTKEGPPEVSRVAFCRPDCRQPNP